MNNQSAPQSPLPSKVPVPHHHLIPVVAVAFGMAVATAIFAWILWPKDSDVDMSSTKMNLKGNVNTENTFTTNSNINNNVNAVVHTNANVAVNTNTTTNSNVNATPEVLPTGVERYTSTALGISFTYLNTSAEKASIQEIGDKVYIGVNFRSDEPLTGGQWVQVIPKDATDTLAQAIKKKFLAGYDVSKCYVEDAKVTGFSATVTTAIISYPAPSNSQDPFWVNSKECPSDYSRSNGARYFWMDSEHPDKLLFFSIGQYAIMGSNDQETDWPRTVRIVPSATAGWKTYTNSSVGYSVKYPASWVVSDCQQNPSFVIFDTKKVTCGSEALGIFDIVLDTGGSTSGWKKSLSNTTESTSTIDGMPASRITGTVSEGMDFGKKDVVFVTKGSLTIRIQYNNKTDGADQQTFNSLLSTFTFTK